MSRPRLAAATAALLLTVVAVHPAGAAITYRPPVDAPVVDAFRLPDGPYGPGNRGLEYATVPGTPVRAIAVGVVVFAGPVAGNLAVTVLHPDGLRSSSSWLATVAVEPGERVALGQVLGTSSDRLHLGVRSAGTYLDPAALFAPTGLRLVPVSGALDGSPARRAPPAARQVDQHGEGWWGWVTGTLADRS